MKPSINFLRHQAFHECNLNTDRQVYAIKTVAYRALTETRTDKSLKSEGPKIMSNDMFYFRTVIIGGPINLFGETLRFTEMRPLYV